MAYDNQGNYYRPSMFGGFQFFPPVIKGLLITNAAVFILMWFFGAFHFDGISMHSVFTSIFGLMPVGEGFYPWQLITYQFMHADFWHLFFNMVFGLWMFGMEVEHVWGAKKFLIYYLSCGVVAGLSQLILSPIFEPALGPTIGASGAIYGVMIAFAAMFPDRYIFLYFLIPIKVKYFVMILIVFGVMSVGGQGNVANLAHLGGAVGGYLYILYDRHRLNRGRNQGAFQSWTSPGKWSRPASSGGDVVEAKVFDINEAKSFEPKEPPVDAQKRIDEILDKISRSGYQSLSEEEKKLLFEASKRMN
ncbi:MAG: rhomboid family intramembrane serine protease [Ignavibacteriae bacterium]|nr:MAG: rhomboid family intramembrane serine protease [Ignavibacteriota bacterium]